MIHYSLPRSPRALAAPLTLAAVLALSSTPAFAQDTAQPSGAASSTAAPIVIAPPPPASPTAAPAVAVPDVTAGSGQATANVPDPAASNPVVQPIPPTTSAEGSPDAAPDAADTATTAPSSERAVRKPLPRSVAAASVPTARPVATSARRSPGQVASEQTTANDSALAKGATPAAPLAAAKPAPAQTAPAQPAPQARPANASNDYTLPIAGTIGLIAAFGIAAAGIVGMRRTRRRVEEEQAWDDTYEPEGTAVAPAQPATEPLYAQAVMAPADEGRATGALTLDPPVLSPAVSTVPPHASATIGKPAGDAADMTAADVLAASPLPETAEERQELLERMVAAEPGEDNPFHARKSRLRRARIQLQHREHLAEEAQARGERFDFRSYTPASNRAGNTAGQTTEAQPVPVREDTLADA